MPSNRNNNSGTPVSISAFKSLQVVACENPFPSLSPCPLMNINTHEGKNIRGVLGYGSIGRQCARLGQALGMDVYAYTLSEKKTPASRRNDTYCVPGTGDPEGLIPSKWFSGSSKQDIDNFLAQDLDLLIISLPLNSATRGLLSTEQFQILGRKPNKTFVSNIARGPIVDDAALVHALETGLIRGAAIDVADPEPLPEGHILWEAPNLFITPHIAWMSSQYWDNLSNLLLQNLDRLARGESVINPDKRAS